MRCFDKLKRTASKVILTLELLVFH